MINPVRAELGELLAGTASGRARDDELTVFESLGVAAEDLAAAGFLYQKAARLGAGTFADFSGPPAPTPRPRPAAHF